MLTNKDILDSILQLTQALTATVKDAGQNKNPEFFKDSIKLSALSIYEKAQLLADPENVKTVIAHPTPEIKIIRQEEIKPDIHKPVAEVKPAIATPPAEIPEIVVKNETTLPVVEKKEVKKQETPVQKPAQNPNEEEDNSLNARIAKFQQPVINVADKMKDTPIKELVKAISISKKFEFINGLFNGNSEHYKTAIQSIDKCPDLRSAERFIEEQIAEVNGWNENEDLAAEFFSLVNRRFL